MIKFLEIFDTKGQEFEDAGGNINDEEKVYQLSSALPIQYDSVLEWYKDSRMEEQTYEAYQKKAIEKWRRIKLSIIRNKMLRIQFVILNLNPMMILKVKLVPFFASIVIRRNIWYQSAQNSPTRTRIPNQLSNRVLI